MKKIKIKFVDFWPNFNYKNHFLYGELSKRYEIEISDHPDYIFFSVFGNENLNYRNCVRIFYTAENISPDFNICDYAIGFDYINFDDRYLRLPNYYNYNYEKNFELIENRKKIDKLDRKEFCCFVYSNSKADKFREELYELISSYKTVKSGGKFKNNVGGPVKNKLEFQKQFKFCIACENASYPGYTTEKILDAFASGCIPIYWGDPLVENVFNKKAFINCLNYKNTDDLLKFIKKVDNDDSLYLEMINQPIFNNEHDFQKMKLIELDNFLFHIFDQKLNDSYRYNRTFYRDIYFTKMYDSNRLYNRSLKSILKKCVQSMRLMRKKR